MKRILFATALLLFSFSAIQAQEYKKVESNLMFNRGIFFQTGSSTDFGFLLSLLACRVSRLSYGLDFRMSDRWSLMPGVGARLQNRGSFLFIIPLGVIAAADAFCVLRYHIPVGEDQIIIGLGPDVSFLSKSNYYFGSVAYDPLQDKQEFYRFDYGIQPSVTFRTGKHWQWGLEANFGLRNMRIPYDFYYCYPDEPDYRRHISVKGSTYFHTISLTCGFNF